MQKIRTICFLLVFFQCLACIFNQCFCEWPSFRFSMATWGEFAKGRYFDQKAALHNNYVQNGEASYNMFWKNGLKKDSTPRIPKIIHQIWLGSPFPEKYKRLQQTWKEQHPDWKYILWTDKEIKEFHLVNEKLFNQANNYGQKSDIARYEILCRMGGLYVDTDFECLKPFDDLHYSLDFYTSCLPEKNGSLTLLNGLIASRPNHPILEACIKKLSDIQKLNTNKGNILSTTGPYFFTKCVYENLNSKADRSVIFPVSFFYPLPNDLRLQKFTLEDVKKKFVRDETFAIHWWCCSWQ